MSIPHYSSTAINRFCSYLKSANLSQKTLKAYAADLRLFFGYIPPATRIPEIIEQHIRAFFKDSISGKCNLSQNPSSPATCNRRLATLKKFFAWAKYENIIKKDPSHLVPFFHIPQRPPCYIKSDEVTRMKLYALRKTFFDFVLVHTLYSFALRTEEICNLTVADIDFTDSRIHVKGKRDKERNLPMLPEDIKHLSKWISMRPPRISHDKLFYTSRMSPLNWKYIYDHIDKIAYSCNVECTPHTLRHSRATHLLAAGFNIYYIKVFLGHNSIMTTEGYTHVSDPTLRDAYERASSSIRA